MRYYIVDCELGTEKFQFMVKAKSKADARRHVTDKVTEASLAARDDLVAWVAAGRQIEQAQEAAAEFAEAGETA